MTAMGILHNVQSDMMMLKDHRAIQRLQLQVFLSQFIFRKGNCYQNIEQLYIIILRSFSEQFLLMEVQMGKRVWSSTIIMFTSIFFVSTPVFIDCAIQRFGSLNCLACSATLRSYSFLFCLKQRNNNILLLYTCTLL